MRTRPRRRRDASSRTRPRIPAIFTASVTAGVATYIRERRIDWHQAFRELQEDREAWAAANNYTPAEMSRARHPNDERST